MLLVSYRPLALSLSCKKELAERRATSKGPKRCSLVVQDRLRPWCRPVLTRWEHSYTRRSHNHARAAASCVGVRCMRRLTLAAAALARARGDSCAMAADLHYGSMAMPVLKAVLASHGCDTSGKKEELIERLKGKLVEVEIQQRASAIRTAPSNF